MSLRPSLGIILTLIDLPDTDITLIGLFPKRKHEDYYDIKTPKIDGTEFISALFC